jgi:CheY-like chemotaxis protein
VDVPLNRRFGHPKSMAAGCPAKAGNAAYRSAETMGANMPAKGNPSATILIVDDDPSVRDMLLHAFAVHGYQATAVSTSMDCLRLLDAGTVFDLLIIDVVMPEGTPHGFCLGRMTRYRKPSQRLLYMSGALDVIPEDELKAAEAPVLAKPVRIAELLDTVQRVLATA